MNLETEKIHNLKLSETDLETLKWLLQNYLDITKEPVELIEFADELITEITLAR
jgi:hypothetical protein